MGDSKGDDTDAWLDVDVTRIVELEQLDALLFRSRANQRNINGALYGGQVLAQALAAACGTVGAERPTHSLHGYFLRAGDCDLPVIYQVDATRDGGSFSTRRVVALQKGAAIFHMECSFHGREAGWDHQLSPTPSPPPEALPSLAEIIAEGHHALPPYLVGRFGRPGPIELKPVGVDQLTDRLDRPFRQIWLRAPGAAKTDDPAVHQQILAYLSDYWLSGTVVSVHAAPFAARGVYVASLDHAMWFHRPARADDWLLYDADSPSASDGVGLSRGRLFDRTGRLVASTAQEALFRLSRDKEAAL